MPVQPTFWTVTVTAIVETMRFVAIFTLPSVAAFALRFYLLDRAAGERITQGETPRLTTTQRLLATALGGLTSAILLCLVALLWAAALSETSTHFQQLLFRNEGSFLTYFLWQAFISALVIYGAGRMRRDWISETPMRGHHLRDLCACVAGVAQLRSIGSN